MGSINLAVGYAQSTNPDQLSPAHIFIAAPLPDAWLVPDKLWRLLKVIYLLADLEES